MTRIVLLTMLLVMSACATKDAQIAEYLKKNPKAVFDVIEENPEQFVEVVNKAARKAQQNAQQKQRADLKKQQEEQIVNPLKPKIEESRRLFGDKTAKITIVEYADFQCPACRMAHKSLDQIFKQYSGKIQFYYKHFPLDFHPMAQPAALYYEAVFKQDRSKARKFYDLVFENQRDLKDVDFLRKMAKKVGADMAKVAKDIESKDIRYNIDADMSEFEKMGFTGTPVIVVNGVALHGAQPVEEIEKIIALTTVDSK
ncbi:DsbA family protein [Bdellovibrio sp. SKB1291214]|uniref:DsbA family protein n=1 Tax=Bdellovibrio sp. SKB1291214 TaxID=1732569 RepID=UPI0020CB8AEE|nr:thioredoxin domain-containing protein [Bdellovibrio sp. SKB1291214]UYL09836.1 DsbA family protein [Bdellovibrio sp. SKB1291214]